MTSLLRRFDEKFCTPDFINRLNNKLKYQSNIDAMDEVRDFLRTELGELIVEMQGMKVKKATCYCKTHLEHNCGPTSNDAIDDCIALLAKSLDEGK